VGVVYRQLHLQQENIVLMIDHKLEFGLDGGFVIGLELKVN